MELWDVEGRGELGGAGWWGLGGVDQWEESQVAACVSVSVSQLSVTFMQRLKWRGIILISVL